MKTISILFSFIIFISINVKSQTWNKKQEGMTSYSIQNMVFTSSTVGYACLGDYASPTGSILKTTNSGSTWTTYSTAGTGKTMDIKMIDANTGFCSSDDGEISRTTDAGLTWSEVYQNASTSNYLNRIGFLNSTTGFAAGNKYVVRTTDGGSNWSSSTLTGYIYGSTVLSSTKAFMCGYSSTGSYGRLWTTTNAGTSWGSTNLTQGYTLRDIFFLDANTGWICGDMGVLFKTTNGGSNWSPITTGLNNSFESVYFKDANNGFISGSSGAIFRTTNGGTTFTSAPTSPLASNSTIYDIYFFDADNGIACSSAGAFYKTTDGGSQWVSVGNNQQLNAIVFNNSTNGLAAGEYSCIQKTTDGGDTWTIQTGITVYTHFYCIEYPSASIAYVAGMGGTIYKTTDGGSSWAALTSGVTSDILSLKFLDNNTGFFGTYNGGLGKTTDGGATWSSLTSGITEPLNNIVFTSENTGYICGGSGIVIKTTNQRVDWSATGSTGYTGWLNRLHFFDDNNGIVAGNSGRIYKTTDGGASWSRCTSGTTKSLTSIEFVDPNNGIAVGDMGTIIITTDGGTTWSVQTSGTTQNLRSVEIVNNNNIFVAGALGTILNSTQMLPVELSSFVAEMSKGGVELKWTTSSEVNSHGFEIERTNENAGSDWIKLEFIKSTGNSNTPTNYKYTDKTVSNGNYSYRLKQIDIDGAIKYSNAVEVQLGNFINGYVLNQNYPNPFNPSTTIKFGFENNTRAQLKIYDMLGNEVAELFNDNVDAGRVYNVNFNASSYASGVYYYKLTGNNKTEIKKMMLVK